MYQYNSRKKTIIFWQIFITILFLGLWELLSFYKIINPFIFSSPSKIFMCFYNLFSSGEIFIHLFTTLGEVLLAFFLGISLGIIIAIIFYIFPTIADIFEPFLTILNSLPKVALGPIIIIICGANVKSIIVMALLINLIVSIITIYSGFKTIDETKLKMFRMFKASKKDILYNLVIPTSYNSIVTSLKLNISLTLIGVITGEFLVSKKGIGYLIIYGTQVFNLNLVLTGIFILLIISVLLYKGVTYIEKKVLK